MNGGICHCRRVVKPSIMTRAVCGLNYEQKIIQLEQKSLASLFAFKCNLL